MSGTDEPLLRTTSANAHSETGYSDEGLTEVMDPQATTTCPLGHQ
jgi:hypothetical protein